MAAKMATIATTIINSIRVKPDCFFISNILFVLGSWEVPVENYPHVSILSELFDLATEAGVFVNNLSVICENFYINHG
ncbi:TPA: hypothetical protein JAJ28_001853 [Aeromonas hydrophila]|uniref:Uncharacterized protein n=1 Tax=Aeromonas hydrophila TaxID=644 RepID=A0AAD3U9T8_AERHY|nr:hypothetical protein [Aeromonas hydrophila]